MIVRRVVPPVVLLGLFVVAGCSSGPQFVDVEGTVKQNGKPLSGIQVEFWPVASGPRSMGTTDDQGHYTLMLDDGKRKGAVIGQHNVILKDVAILGTKFLGRKGEDADMSKGKKPRIGGLYSDPQKTPVKKEVVAGPNVINIEVQ
ncbi:MAG: hypothetical protein U0746_06530 [Gemmataceae bacterium]